MQVSKTLTRSWIKVDDDNKN